MAMENSCFDAIVIGLGSMGSAACWRLAQRGAKVLGLDTFSPPHRRGSHGGDSRIVRLAYFEHPDYVPLLQKAYQGWDELAEWKGIAVFERTGLLYFGPTHHPLISGALESSRLYSVPIERAMATSYPLFHVPHDYCCLLERNAGFVRPDLAIQAMLEAAQQYGSQHRTQERVLEWKHERGEIRVNTERGIYRAKKLIVTAGAWGGSVLAQLKAQLQVSLQTLVWAKAKNPAQVAVGTLPCWTLADEQYPGIFYGFPAIPSMVDGSIRGFKLAHHAPGITVTDVDREDPVPQPDSLASVRDILDRYFPNQFEDELEVETCRYTNSPDGDFIIDSLPDTNQSVVYALGFSGHGFKFAPAIGEVLADLALAGETQIPIGFLSAGRFR